MKPANKPFVSCQHCRLLNEPVEVTARSRDPASLDSCEGGALDVVLVCLDKRQECFDLSCHFTTDGGEWPFETPLESLQSTFSHGAGI